MEQQKYDLTWKIIYGTTFSIIMTIAPKYWTGFELIISIVYSIIYFLLSYYIGTLIVQKTREKYPRELLKARLFNLILYSITIFLLFFVLGYLVYILGFT